MANYSVSVEPLAGSSAEDNSLETWKIYHEAARFEYEYAHSNSTKLDNKVYILLAVCAFLFPLLYSVQNKAEGLLSSAALILALISLSAAIIMLLTVLLTVKIARVNVFNALQEGKAGSDSQLEAEMRFAWLYASIRNAGLPAQDKKYRTVDRAIKCIIIAFVLMVLPFIIQEIIVFSKAVKNSMQENNNAVLYSSGSKIADMSYDDIIDYVVRNKAVMPEIPTNQDIVNSRSAYFLGESNDV